MTTRERPFASQTVAVWILAVVAMVWFLREARDLLIPMALGVLISYALEPIVAWLERVGVKRLFGAGLLMLVILAAGAGGAYAYRQDALQLMRTLPGEIE